MMAAITLTRKRSRPANSSAWLLRPRIPVPGRLMLAWGAATGAADFSCWAAGVARRAPRAGLPKAEPGALTPGQRRRAAAPP